MGTTLGCKRKTEILKESNGQENLIFCCQLLATVLGSEMFGGFRICAIKMAEVSDSAAMPSRVHG